MPGQSRLLRRYKGLLIGFALGALAGYAYYYFVGCASGSCPISSNPLISTVYVGVMGALLGAGSAKKKKIHNNEYSETNSN